jgi:hypothetical protein
VHRDFCPLITVTHIDSDACGLWHLEWKRGKGKNEDEVVEDTGGRDGDVSLTHHV